MIPKRPVLVPHIVSFGDQSHLTVDRKQPSQPTFDTTSTMKLSDLNHNKRRLNDVEFVQLLSSLIIRGIQLHRKRERFIPGPFSSYTRSLDNFNDALTISQIPLRSFTDSYQNGFPTSNKLPLIRSASEIARIKTNAQARATKEG